VCELNYTAQISNRPNDQRAVQLNSSSLAKFVVGRQKTGTRLRAIVANKLWQMSTACVTR
jgi:hypothetical protein